MTLARRLIALETSLSPTQRVVAWLDEAHAFGSIEAFVASLLDAPPEAFPLSRLAREAAAGEWTALRGKGADAVAAAVRKAVRETVFRYELFVWINVTVCETVDREGLVHGVLSGQMALLMLAGQDVARGDVLPRLVTCRDLAFRRVDAMLAAAEARVRVEDRYLDGHAALFPDVAELWTERVHEAQVLAAMADRAVELEGGQLLTPPAEEARTEWTAQHVRDLIEPARVTTLEKLDEGRQAIGIATEWVRLRRADTK